MAKGKALSDESLENAASGLSEIYKDEQGNIVGANFYDDKTGKIVGSQIYKSGATLEDVKKTADFFGVSDKGQVISSYEGFTNLENKKT